MGIYSPNYQSVILEGVSKSLVLGRKINVTQSNYYSETFVLEEEALSEKQMTSNLNKVTASGEFIDSDYPTVRSIVYNIFDKIL